MNNENYEMSNIDVKEGLDVSSDLHLSLELKQIINLQEENNIELINTNDYHNLFNRGIGNILSMLLTLIFLILVLKVLKSKIKQNFNIFVIQINCVKITRKNLQGNYL